jgi:hypothetical protein
MEAAGSRGEHHADAATNTRIENPISSTGGEKIH